MTTQLESLLQELTPQVLAALVRRYGQFDRCEDAVQEALLAAALQWPAQGLPEQPRAWLLRVASRRLSDQWRSDSARERREVNNVATLPEEALYAPDPSEELATQRDDSLILFLMCCHPALTAASQIALTLRAVGGLTTAQIAQAFMVPEASMAQRISRAKQRIKSSGEAFALPPPELLPARLQSVLHVLYLIFNEDYTALQSAELTREAIRLTRQLHHLRPDDGEVQGLLALMLLSEARRPARITADAGLVPLAEQDRSRWDKAMINEGLALIQHALASYPLGPYQIQAAIAALHAEASSAATTDWAQIVALYELLEQFGPNPIITLNRAVALAMLAGPEAALALLDQLEQDQRLASHHRLAAVRAHLYEQAGRLNEAQISYRLAAERSSNPAEQAYLLAQATRLAQQLA